MSKDKIVIIVKTARLTRDTDTLGSMEPYCKLKYDGVKQKTKVDSSGGKTPTWEETFTYEVTDCKVLIVSVWESDAMVNEEVGTAEIDINTLKSHGNFADWIKLKYKDEGAGEIYCEIMYVPIDGVPASDFTPPADGITIKPEIIPAPVPDQPPHHKDHDDGDQSKEHNEADQHHDKDQPKLHNEGEQSKEHNEADQHHDKDQPKLHNEGDKPKEHNEGDQPKEHKEADQHQDHHKEDQEEHKGPSSSCHKWGGSGQKKNGKPCKWSKPKASKSKKNKHHGEHDENEHQEHKEKHHKHHDDHDHHDSHKHKRSGSSSSSSSSSSNSSGH